MEIAFTKMQGAGNDFVVLDQTADSYRLSPEQIRFLADRHFGVGADQVLCVRPAPSADLDFEYVIYNADGGEVQQCGNGARCFARFVRDKGLSDKDSLRVQTLAGPIVLQLGADGVTVDMGRPIFDPLQAPFSATGLQPQPEGTWQTWPLTREGPGQETLLHVAVLSMGNPHAVMLVDDVDSAPVAELGPLIGNHFRFPERANAGFLQVVDPHHVRLRVYERGAGETLACGSGACAAVVAGIRMGYLASPVRVQTRGGELSIAWSGLAADSVFMTGPATTVFEGRIHIPEPL
ncbi:MAG: diaminopimelate epimerase [Burkholderiaceae bacterium]|nr:diaminopimelate epimerase [Burkholderiaceae bacterium]